MSPEELQKRCDYIASVIFPAISTKSKEKQKKISKVFKADDPFPDGSFVMTLDPVWRSKLDPVYEGPYKVLHHNQRGSYILQDQAGVLLL